MYFEEVISITVDTFRTWKASDEGNVYGETAAETRLSSHYRR
jgi:hypothetical protein